MLLVAQILKEKDCSMNFLTLVCKNKNTHNYYECSKMLKQSECNKNIKINMKY